MAPFRSDESLEGGQSVPVVVVLKHLPRRDLGKLTNRGRDHNVTLTIKSKAQVTIWEQPDALFIHFHRKHTWPLCLVWVWVWVWVCWKTKSALNHSFQKKKFKKLSPPAMRDSEDVVWATFLGPEFLFLHKLVSYTKKQKKRKSNQNSPWRKKDKKRAS